MASAVKITQNKTSTQVLRHFPDGTIKLGYGAELNIKDIIGKDLYAMYSKYNDLDSNFLSNVKDYISPDKYPVLFVSSASKISRDALRNGGYKITYDKSRANCVVIPRIKRSYKRTCNAVYQEDDGGIVLYDFETLPKSTDEGYCDGITEEIAADFEVYFKDSGMDMTKLFHVSNYQRFNVFFTSKCDELIDITDSYRYNGCAYVQDVDILYDMPSVISPETLMVWKKMRNDIKMFEKVLVNSDWKKYPMTMCLFIYNDITRNQYNFGPQGRVVLDAINYDLYYSGGSLGSQVVTPEDWNMLQSYLMLRFGVDETGGLINGDDLGNWSDFLRHRMAIVPTKFEDNMLYKDAVAVIKNRN